MLSKSVQPTFSSNPAKFSPVNSRIYLIKSIPPTTKIQLTLITKFKIILNCNFMQVKGEKRG